MAEDGWLAHWLDHAVAWLIVGTLFALYARWKKRSPLWWGLIGALAWLPTLVALIIAARGPIAPTPSTARSRVLTALALLLLGIALVAPAWAWYMAGITERWAGERRVLSAVETAMVWSAHIELRYGGWIRAALAGLAALCLKLRVTAPSSMESQRRPH